jgi:tetratricopeptide (TPR) repeat protein
MFIEWNPVFYDTTRGRTITPFDFLQTFDSSGIEENENIMDQNVKAHQTKLNIPTYELGKSEINPVFFEKRVYQGSSGKVYPVPFIDKVFDEKVDKFYDAAILENDFVKLVLLPEIGGRIFESQDKTNNNYNFFYQQKVIKPALVGLAGPWISGGVEFNWPQHHRPGTYLPTDVFIEEEDDGVKTVWMSEYDPMNRLKGMHGIRIRPNSALIELRARLFNRTPLTHTFLWWANVAVRVHEDYQSFFPPDVHYVADHAVRAMSSFPIAENDYYDIPYHKRPGRNDLRFYQNIPVPTSYMVCETNFDFFGGYDFKSEGGFIHVANRHIAPGKKQWTWGDEAFGKAWDRELTDEGGPYFELMAGVYTDNQPDFTYLLPYETKTFSQFWWSYKKIGPVQNANNDLAIRLEILQGNKLDLGVAASRKFDNLKFILKIGNGQTVFDKITVSPENPWIEKSLGIESGQENSVSFFIQNEQGIELLGFRRCEVNKQRNRKVAKEPGQPSEVESVNELELIGEHLELNRHPTRYPEPYWEEAVRRDPKSYKSHIALGRSALKNGKFATAEKELYKAIDILTSYHPNPVTGEAHYFGGLACLFQQKYHEAYPLFYKATWNFEWRSAAYYQLALLNCKNRNFARALEQLEASLDTNRQNNKAFILKAIIKKRQGEKAIAEYILKDLLKTDPLDQWARFELEGLSGNYEDFLNSSRNDAQTVIDIAFDYAEADFNEEAVQLIELHHQNEIPECAVPNPMGRSAMTKFILAWLYERVGEKEKSVKILAEAASSSKDYFFPSRTNEQLVLEWAIGQKGEIDLAAYGLGNYYYNLKRHNDAIKCWEKAASRGSAYATIYRNLGIAYWNTDRDGEKARAAFQKAVQLSPNDMRIQYEFDQLRKKLNDSPVERLAALEPLQSEILQRDDFSVELAAMYNFNGDYEKTLELLENKRFHPWEGGEGQVLLQFTHACLKLGQLALQNGDAEMAFEYFEKSMNTPDNLGEKYHPLQAIAHINYWKGMALKALGKEKEASAHFHASTNEEGDFINMTVSAYSELSYYKALSLKELGKTAEAQKLLAEIKTFGEAKLTEKAQIEYFATSLPLLLVFDDDLQKRNEVDAKYLISLAQFGLGNKENAREILQQLVKLNTMHAGVKEMLEGTIL